MALFRRRGTGAERAPTTVRDVGGGRVDVWSPVDWDELNRLGSAVTVVQFSTPLTDAEHRGLAEWFAGHPGVELRVYGNYSHAIRDLDFLRHYTSLDALSVDSMRSTGEPALSDVDALLALPEGLRALGLAVRLPADFPLERLARYQQLASVSVAEQKTVPDFLTGLPSLRKLYVVGPVRSIDPLARMATLEDLTLRSVTAPDLRPLTHLHALRSLDIKLGGLRDLSLLPEVGRLTYLELWQIRGLSDISSVAGLAALEELFLQSLRQVTALPDLSRCSALRRVHLETMKGLTDLTPLAAAPALEELLLVDAGHLQPDVLLPLVGHPTLRTARLGFGSLRKNAQAEALLGIPGPAD